MLTLDSLIVASPAQVSAKLAEEAVILGLKGRIYYGLDAVGARIWELLQSPVSVGELCRKLAEEFQVDGEQRERETLAFLEQLRTEDLLDVKHSG